jgi:hypothetical protein
VLLGVLLACALGARGSLAEDTEPAPPPAQPSLVRQANAPLSNIFQIRLQDTYLPEFEDVDGQGNVLTLSMTMPLPAYRVLPRPQLSVLTMPAAVTLPDGTTGFGDMRFLNIVVMNAGPRLLWGVGPSFVFPTASEPTTGQGKWQLGPAAVIGLIRKDWTVGVLAQNPISFAGEREREHTNALNLLPFATYQLGGGWFLRSQPQMLFNWRTGGQIVPLDLGAGRLFKIGRQTINAFVEPFWNVVTDRRAPRYGVLFGITLLYPDFWQTE